MSPEHRRYLVVEQGVGAAIVNFVLASLFGWLMFRHLEQVPVWGSSSSVVSDTLGTALLLPLITCLIVTPLARIAVRSGRFEMLEPGRLARWAPRRTVLRAILIGVVCLAILTPLVLLALSKIGAPSLPLRHFLIVKSVFAAAEGALITPVIALLAISGTSPAPQPALRSA